MQAVILAGGKGRRLLPYTTVLPKPLMPIGDYPILEVILRQLKYYGFDDITICTGYLHELIHAYLDYTRDPDANITYTHEREPLGTIGPLHLIKKLDDNFLVMNGDVLSDIDFLSLFKTHTQRNAMATIATFKREVNMEFGVIEKNKKSRITGFSEKPHYHFDVSMGVNVFSGEVLDLIPKGTPFGFDQLMISLIENHKPVFSYPHEGYWLDIGKPDDYARSVEEFEMYKKMLLPGML